MNLANKKDIVYQQIKKNIMSGKYSPGMRLPKEVEFAKHFGVSRITLRPALDRLLDDGMVKRLRGKGTFVATANEIKARRYLAIMPPDDESFESPMTHIMPGIEANAAEVSAHIQKYSINLFKSLEIAEGVPRIQEGRYNGVFYMGNGVNGDEQDIKIFKASGLPVIIPHASINDHSITGFATMRPNDEKAFSAVLELLASKGHKRIGSIFLGKKDTAKCRSFQLSDYTRFLKKVGIDNSPEFIHYYTEYHYDSIAEKVKKLMQLPKRPTAILCSSDFVALYVYQVLRKMEIKIPEQVAVMGYCNSPEGELLSPPLSTVDLFFEKTGRDAFELMLRSDEWWKPGLEAPQITTPFKIIERGSTNIQL